MIYRRENPTTPSKRFRSVILNPVGSKIICKSFYISKRPRVAKHFGKNVMFSKKKSIYKTTFNINYSKYQQGTGFVAQISAERRYKTFVGLVRYSNGAISCVPLFSGAYIMQLIKAWPYARTPKYIKASNIKTGSVMAIAYLSITNCFFNVTSGTNKIWALCKAGGTFCIVMRINASRSVCIVKLPSGKLYKLVESLYVTLGRNSNTFIQGIWIGKAGFNVNKGWRSSVRGVAKNPIDHPHGGRTKSNSPERTPWGRVAKHNK